MTEFPVRTRLGWSVVAVLILVFGGLTLHLAYRGVHLSHSALAAHGEPVSVPEGTEFIRGERFAIDTADSDRPVLWAFARIGADLRVRRWLVNKASISLQRESLILSPPAGHVVAAVVPWQGEGRALVLAAPHGRSIALQIRRVTPPFAIFEQAQTPALSLRKGNLRSISVDSSSRGTAKLIVVDRPLAEKGDMSIRVLSASTHFKSVTANVQRSGRDSFPVRTWRLVVGGVDSPFGDLLFISHMQPTATGKIEVHTLLASKNYSRYGTQRPLDRPEGEAKGWSYALTRTARGTPVLYGIDLARHVLMRFPL